jgi:hypothetical protein
VGISIAEAKQARGERRALSNLAVRTREQRELAAELRGRIASVTEYRDGLVVKRDRKAEQIPLRPHEERMWSNKIAQADATIASMQAELSALGW